MFHNISVKIWVKAGTLRRRSHLNSQHFLPNRTFSQEWFCCCARVVQMETIIHHFRTHRFRSITSAHKYRFCFSLYPPQRLRITHITSSAYQTVKCGTLARRLRVIIKMFVPQCPANEIKVGDKSRRGLSKQARHCKQATMAPKLLWSKTPSNKLRGFPLKSFLFCSARAVDFHECAILPALFSGFKELKWTHIDKILMLVPIYYVITHATTAWKRSASGGLSFLCTPVHAEPPPPVLLPSLKGSGSASFVVHKSSKTTSWQEPG